MSFFGSDKKHESDLLVQSDGSLVAVSRNGLQAGFVSANGSNASTIIKKSSHLRLIGGSCEHVQPTSAKSAPVTPHPALSGDEECLSPPLLPRKQSRVTLRRSPSTPALHSKIQHKLQQHFGNHPTVVVKTGLRSRPSVQTLQNEVPDWVASQMSSSPSTYTSGSGSSPKGANKSTPATSDGYPSSPTSVRHHEGITLVDHDQSIILGPDSVPSSRLSTIPEASASASVSIKTVEATAAAKVFFEVHFNTILNARSPRDIREQELETRMRELSMPLGLQQDARKTWYKHETAHLRICRVLQSAVTAPAKPVAVGGFEVVKVLGKGSFGVVRLVKEQAMPRRPSMGLINLPSRANLKSAAKEMLAPYRGNRDAPKLKKDVFAMKVIRKSDMLRNGQEGHLRAERDFLVAAEGSEWIISLLAAFQDNNFLYLVMDFCIGGDFLGLLIRKNILSEDVTRWYIAEMILCVEAAHRMKWIHRDVKPDNFLIGSDGHLKISDFGLAFDGDWEHDQKFYHKHRYDVIDRLGLEIRGDEQDIADDAEVDNSRKVAEMFPPPGCRPPKKHTPSDEGADGEPILDWRNRAQRRRLARSVVGTSQYMAPEVIRGDMYDGRCD